MNSNPAPLIRHPDFEAEAAHVRQTVQKAETHYTEIRALEAKQEADVHRLRIETGGVGSDMDVAEMHLYMTQKVRRNLESARKKPIFSRIDFTDPKGSHSYYIGKWGLSDPVTMVPYVIDWRSPIADLYYTGQVGQAGYQTPGGYVEGEITKKRILSCEDGELVDLIEASIVTQDAYLNTVLSDHANDRLRDIVTTIQAEQNAILRFDRHRPVIVQGVAGAGKTTVALHRITWLLYTFQDTMAPSNLMVLAPNPLFLNYISAVLPDLGVEDVLQTTYHGLAEKVCGCRLPECEDGTVLARLIDSEVSQEEKERLFSISAFKSGLVFRKALEAYIQYLQTAALPDGDVKMGPVRLYSREQLEAVFCRDLSPFPLVPRKAEFRKHLKERCREGLVRWIAAYESEVEKRANLLRVQMPENTPKRQAMMQRLYAQRDEKKKEAEAAARAFPQEYLKAFPEISLLDRYREFLSEDPVFPLPAEIDPALWQEVCRESRSVFDRKKLDVSDLAPLITLNRALLGDAVRLDIHHTVIDEAQDLSDFQLEVLRDLCRNASFTIVGDLNQGIHSYRGVTDWKRMTRHVFPDAKWAEFELVTSYRSTVEIMSFAQRVASRHPFPGQSEAKPVLRHGPEPILKKSSDPVSDTAQEILRLKEAGCKSIAIVGKLPRDCAALHKKLRRKLPDLPIRLLTEKDTEYSAGVMVIPAALTKGLEFDAVILTDLSDDTWPDDRLHARLLYVCLTRPLHHLVCLYDNVPSKLILASS